MKLLIISDLHVDTCDSFGTFQWNEMDFILRIEDLRDKFRIDKVIFNGDTFELMKYSFAEIASANPILMKYFPEDGLYYLLYLF